MEILWKDRVSAEFRAKWQSFAQNSVEIPVFYSIRACHMTKTRTSSLCSGMFCLSFRLKLAIVNSDNLISAIDQEYISKFP